MGVLNYFHDVLHITPSLRFLISCKIKGDFKILRDASEINPYFLFLGLTLIPSPDSLFLIFGTDPDSLFGTYDVYMHNTASEWRHEYRGSSHFR
jgi:hypothetical protein